MNLRDVSVPASENAEINIGPVDEREGGLDGVTINGGQMFHHLGHAIQTQTGRHDFPAVLGEIQRCAADHYYRSLGHGDFSLSRQADG